MQYIFFPKHEKTSVKLDWLADYIAIVDDYDYEKPFCIAGQLSSLLTDTTLSYYPHEDFLSENLGIGYNDTHNLYWYKSRTQKGAVQALRELAKKYKKNGN